MLVLHTRAGGIDPQGQAGSWLPTLNLAPLTAQAGHGGAKHHDLAPVTVSRNLMVPTNRKEI